MTIVNEEKQKEKKKQTGGGRKKMLKIPICRICRLFRVLLEGTVMQRLAR